MIKTTKEIFKNNKFNSWLRGGENNEWSAVNRLKENFVNIDASGTLGAIKQPCFAIGSCFAREIEDELERQGVPCLSKELIIKCINESPEHFKIKDVDGRTYAFLNRYSPASLKTFFDFLKEDFLGNSLLVASKEDPSKYDDLLFTRIFQPQNIELCHQRRAKIRDSMRLALKNSSRLIITLGLIEYFATQVEGTDIAANIPPSINSADFNDYIFNIETTSTTISSIKHIIKIAKSFNNQIQVIITVSPVPLDATFRDMDIIIANNFSKAVLISAVNELINKEPKDYCHYFPSYELVTNSDRNSAWRDDLRHVAPQMVEHILKKFIEANK